MAVDRLALLGDTLKRMFGIREKSLHEQLKGRRARSTWFKMKEGWNPNREKLLATALLAKKISGEPLSVLESRDLTRYLEPLSETISRRGMGELVLPSDVQSLLPKGPGSERFPRGKDYDPATDPETLKYEETVRILMRKAAELQKKRGSGS